MSRFTAKGQSAVLQLELATSANTPAEVVAYSAYGATSTGSTTRPVFSRPASGGTPSEASRAYSITPSTTPATAAYATFAVSPTTPSGLASGSFNLPMVIRWATARGKGIILAQSTFGLLYALATGGHSWVGEIQWEEK